LDTKYPNIFFSHSVRGDAKMKQGKKEEAIADYEELISFDPKDNTDILVNKGYAYLR
jgi:predicted negative regulator of RcsB-dependent stress response